MRALIPHDVIFSLQNAYAEGLISGTKCVELRRRVPALDSGTRVWLYSKVPTGGVVGVGILSEVETGSPTELWKQYSQCSGLSENDFFTYFAGVDKGAAMRFVTVARLVNPITLDALKSLEPNFHPPQFFRRVRSQALRQELVNSETSLPHDPCDH
jgi:predicted transcriptional regulator